MAIGLAAILVRLLLLMGAAYGLLITLRNYFQALAHNIRPERRGP
jgi:uncharacterized protein YneF (UPF0154 family)